MGLLQKKRRLYSGDDQQRLETINTELEGDSISLAFRDFKRLTQDALEAETLGTFLERNQATKLADGQFMSSEGLPLYYHRLGQRILLISHGERQPGLYECYLEAALLGANFVELEYHIIEVDDDPKVTGCTSRALEGFYKPPKLSIYSDRNYARNHKSFLCDSVDLSRFKFKDSARVTDFVSAGYLTASGFFVRDSVKELFSQFELSECRFLACTAYQNDTPQELWFLQALDAPVIDYDQSRFLISGGMHSSIHEVVGFANQQEHAEKRIALARTPERPSLLPDFIALRSYPDFFKLPETLDFFISSRLKAALEENGISGYRLRSH